MRRIKQRRLRKTLVPAIAVAGILSLGTAPGWAQQGKQDKPTQSKQSSQARQQDKIAEGLIAIDSLRDQKVVDAKNREIGTISNLFVEPKSGRIERVNVEFSSGLFGADHKYSVAWDKLTVKREGQDLVLTMDESIVKRVQQAGKTGRVAEGEGVYAQREDRGILGRGDSQKSQPIQASQLSSEQIRKVQQKLNQEGFHAGQVDGKWSSETQTAIRNFQKKKGIQVTGQLDERTLDELGLDADEFRQKSQSGARKGESRSESTSSGSKR